jgi:hypothetical protein
MRKSFETDKWHFSYWMNQGKELPDLFNDYPVAVPLGIVTTMHWSIR